MVILIESSTANKRTVEMKKSSVFERWDTANLLFCPRPTVNRVGGCYRLNIPIGDDFVRVSKFKLKWKRIQLSSVPVFDPTVKVPVRDSADMVATYGNFPRKRPHNTSAR